MNKRIFTLVISLTLFVLCLQAQTQQDSISTGHNATKQNEVFQLEVPIYKLFPTENYWCLIKLDTRNGKMWQVHFSVSDGYTGEVILNSRSLVWTEEEEMNGRFTLYPTKNMYNFILLDQVNGRTYQVQWNNEKEKRFVTRIY